MELINKIAAIRTSDPQIAKMVANARVANVEKILEMRANRGGKEYAKSSIAYNNFNKRDNKKKIRNKMKQPVVAGKDIDVSAVNNLTGNYYIGDKLERNGRVHNQDYERNLNARFRENYRKNLSKSRSNSVFRGNALASSRPKAIAALTAGGLGLGLLGYGLGHLGGDSPEELEALHQQAQEIQAGDNYKLPLAIGAGTLGAAYMLGDKNDRRRMTNGREYNPYS